MINVKGKRYRAALGYLSTDNADVIVACKKNPAWELEGGEESPADDAIKAEKDAIKAKLDEKGISYHPNTGIEKLKTLLEESEGDE